MFDQDADYQRSVSFCIMQIGELAGKLSAEFREYLYVRALFLGVDPEMLKTRFERASGLPAAKLEELGKVTGFFRKPLIEDEEED